MKKDIDAIEKAFGLAAGSGPFIREWNDREFPPLSRRQRERADIRFVELRAKKLHAGGGHGFDHSERVLKLARKIAADEGKKGKKIDFLVLEAACLLHDVARGLEESGECSCHAEKGAELAEKILRELNFPADKIEQVKHCILVHRYSRKRKAQTIEAKILQDADRLDVLGAIAIARTIEFGARSGRPVHDPSKKPKKKYDGGSETAINHLKEKILAIKPGTFHTSLARKLARRRYLFVEKFVEEFEAEWSGGK